MTNINMVQPDYVMFCIKYKNDDKNDEECSGRSNLFFRSGGEKVNVCNSCGAHWLWSRFVYHDYCKFV